MRVLAFDLAQATGWAAADSASAVRTTGLERRGAPFAAAFGSAKLWQSADSHGARWAGAARALAEIVEREEPDLIVYEAPFLSRFVAASRSGFGLAAVAELTFCTRSDARVYECTAPAWRAYFLGKPLPKGRAALKRAVMQQCAMMGWQVANDNEADALGLLAYALALVTEGKQWAARGKCQ